MQAEIISVGTELLLGHTVNTDAAFIARELAVLGIDLHNVTVVGDNPQRLREALAQAMKRSQLVITTGGLGPTMDDLTKKAVADLLHRPMKLHEASLAQLKEYFGSRPIGSNQESQAYFPEGAQVFANSIGTAPGCAITAENGTLFMLFPGPPRELEPMFRNEAMPMLRKKIGSSIVSFMVRTFGQGEGDAALKLGKLCAQTNPTVATYLGAHGEVFVRVTAKGETQAQAKAMALPTVAEVRERLGDVVYGVDVESLEEVVINTLIKRKEEVATAESCTGGLLSKRLTDIPGSSAVFRTGLVTYADITKTRLLGVPQEMIARYGAVSREVASAMAEGVRMRSAADYGIGITGIAGPGGGTPQKPVGTVWIALATKNKCYATCLNPTGRYAGRNVIRQRSVGKALDMLRRCMEGKPVVPEE